MNLKMSDVRRIIREEWAKYLAEDVDRVRRHKDGHGDDLEEEVEAESVDRVHRHQDGYGDQLEECGDMGAMPQLPRIPDEEEQPQVIVLPLEGKQRK